MPLFLVSVIKLDLTSKQPTLICKTCWIYHPQSPSRKKSLRWVFVCLCDFTFTDIVQCTDFYLVCFEHSKSDFLSSQFIVYIAI